jgi:hypothetical protein
MSLPFNIRADLTLSYFVILFFNYLKGLHVLPSSIHFVIFKNSFLLNHEDPRDMPHVISPRPSPVVNHTCEMNYKYVL